MHILPEETRRRDEEANKHLFKWHEMRDAERLMVAEVNAKRRALLKWRREMGAVFKKSVDVRMGRD